MEPGPYPNPLPTAPVPTVSVSFAKPNDWGSGYCARVEVSNLSQVKAVGWTVELPVQGRPTGLWNGKYTLENGVMTLSGPDWKPDLAAGATWDGTGFFAAR